MSSIAIWVYSRLEAPQGTYKLKQKLKLLNKNDYIFHSSMNFPSSFSLASSRKKISLFFFYSFVSFFALHSFYFIFSFCLPFRCAFLLFSVQLALFARISRESVLHVGANWQTAFTKKKRTNERTFLRHEKVQVCVCVCAAS